MSAIREEHFKIYRNTFNTFDRYILKLEEVYENPKKRWQSRVALFSHFSACPSPGAGALDTSCLKLNMNAAKSRLVPTCASAAYSRAYSYCRRQAVQLLQKSLSPPNSLSPAEIIISFQLLQKSSSREEILTSFQLLQKSSSQAEILNSFQLLQKS